MASTNNPLEIERRYLVANESWRASIQKALYVEQGYLVTRKGCKGARVRIVTHGDKAQQGFITVKGKPLGKGYTREEHETEIPVVIAETLLCSAASFIQKTRYLVPHEGHVWEVDVFQGGNDGLVIAEVELSHEDEHIVLPPWVGRDVTTIKKYTNRNLAKPHRCAK